MVSFKTNINFFYNFFIIFFFIILLNIAFYIILENFFLYSFVEIINNRNYYISLFFFILFFIFAILSIYFYYKKKNTEIIITIFNFKFEKYLKILLFITSIGIVSSFLFKLIPQYLFFLSGTNAEMQNFSCFLHQAKGYVFEKEYLFSNNNNFFFTFANKTSWIWTVLINYYYVIIFFLILFYKKLSKRYILISVILILISVILYFVTTGSKIILLNSMIISFIALLFSYSLNLISFRRFFAISLLTSFAAISIYVIAQQARTACIKDKLTSEAYNSNIEFNRKYFYKKIDSSINNINYLRSLIHNNITANYSLFYLLSGKISGDFLLYLDENKKFKAGNFIYYKQVFNKIAIDLKKVGIKNIKYYAYDENFSARLNNIVSLYHMMFRDFGFLNLCVLMFFFLLMFLQFIYFKNFFSIFIFIYSSLIIFYSAAGLGFANLLATFNTNIIFFNFFVFFLLFFLKSKIVIK